MRLVSERDELVGLHVEFPLVTVNELAYQFHTDPFPNLKGHVNYQELDKCYMHFSSVYSWAKLGL